MKAYERRGLRLVRAPRSVRPSRLKPRCESLGVHRRGGPIDERRLDELLSHGARVGELSARIALRLDGSAHDADRLRLAGMLHDLGKLQLPAHVLDKPGRLTDDEYATVRLHPLIGYRMLAGIGGIEDVRSAVLHHHERMDGGGYPLGLSRSTIPMIARIVSLSDAFDAMTNERPYVEALSQAAARMEIARHAGTQFDPEIAEAFAETPSDDLRLACDARVAGEARRIVGLAVGLANEASRRLAA